MLSKCSFQPFHKGFIDAKKYIVLIFLLFAIPTFFILIVAYQYYQIERNNAYQKAVADESAVVNAGKITIEKVLDSVRQDLSYLSEYHEFKRYVNTHQFNHADDMINDYILLMKSKVNYDQIRWIDETGWERIRVNYLNGFPEATKEYDLQYKGERYYFKNVSHQSKGYIYLSPFDLNMNQGIIEKPYKPVIRFAIPVIDSHAHFRGVLVINYLGKNLLDIMLQSTSETMGSVMLLNSGGYWLKGRSSEEEFGFMFGRKDLTLATQNPSAWKRISAQQNGTFQDEKGLWTFQTIYPIQDSSKNNLVDASYQWKIVSYVPLSKVYEASDDRLKPIIFSTLIILGLVLLGSLILSYFYRRQRESYKLIKNLQQQTEDLLLAVPDIIMQVDTNKRYIWANSEGYAFFGNDVLGKEASDFFVGEQDTYERIHPMMMDETDSVYVESWQKRSDGETRLLAWWCRNLKDDSGNITGALSSARDITEEFENEKRLMFQSQIIEQVDDVVYLTDRNGNITYVNRAFCHHTGYSKEEVIGKPSNIFKSGMHDHSFYKNLWYTILSGDVFRDTLINRKKNGDLYYEKKTISPIKDNQYKVIGFVSTGKDVTEEVMKHKEVALIATTDGLTGIYNRRKAEELFKIERERSSRYNTPLSLIIIDIDRFKSINDTYGHDTGDTVLKRLVSIVSENIRQSDIFARWGGEEFIIVCPGTNETEVIRFAEKIRMAVADASFVAVGEVTVSLGVSTLETDDTFTTLFKRSDMGLYEAKASGRNRTVFKGKEN